MASSKTSYLAAIFTLPLAILFFFLNAKGFSHLHFDEVGNPHAHTHSHADMHFSFPQYWLRPEIHSGEICLKFKDLHRAAGPFKFQGVIGDGLRICRPSVALHKIRLRYSSPHIQLSHLRKILSIRLTI